MDIHEGGPKQISTAEDLKELGVAAIGHRLLIEIAALPAGGARAADAALAPPYHSTGGGRGGATLVDRVFSDLVGSTPLSSG